VPVTPTLAEIQTQPENYRFLASRLIDDHARPHPPQNEYLFELLQLSALVPALASMTTPYAVFTRGSPSRNICRIRTFLARSASYHIICPTSPSFAIFCWPHPRIPSPHQPGRNHLPDIDPWLPSTYPLCSASGRDHQSGPISHVMSRTLLAVSSS
jgi:hypothetical protein